MRIPDNTLYLSRIKAYGTLGLSMDGVTPEAGCPRFYRAKYESHTIQEPESAAAAYGSLIHDVLFLAEEQDLPLLPDALNAAWERAEVTLDASMYEEAVRDLTRYLDRSDGMLATIASEQHLTMPLCEIDGQQYFLGGYIDRLEIDPEDPLTIYLRDFKTNRQPPSQHDLDRNNQFTLYAALVRANLDKYMPGVDPETVTIVGIFDAIKWYELSTYRDGWQLDQFEDWARAVCRRIVHDQEAEPILNPSCSWCPIKFDCPAFRKLPGQGDTIADRMSTMTDLEQRVYFMQSAELTIKALKAAVEDVKTELRDAVHDKPLRFNGVEYYEDEAWKTDWDTQKLHEILGDSFYNVVSPTAYKVEAALKGDPEKKNQIDAVKVRYPSDKPQLKSRKVDDE